LSSFFLAMFVPIYLVPLRHMTRETAVGLAAIAGGLLEALFAPWFWFLFLVFFTGFYAAGRSGKEVVRVVFFWIPASLICLFSFGWLLLFWYLAWSHRLG
jgi:hypothetical protein